MQMRKLYLILIFFSLLAFKVSNAQENFATPIVIGELVGVYDCGAVYSNSQNTCGFANDFAGYYTSADVVYQFTVSATSTVVLDMCTGTDYDSYLYLCDPSQAIITYNDDYCGGASYLSYTVGPGTYYIVVEGFSSYCGNYTLQVSLSDVTAPVPDVATLPNVTGDGTVNVLTTPTATDACEGSIAGTTTDPLTYSVPGTYTITWTYNDGLGNTSTQTQTVVVVANPIVIGELIGVYDCGQPAYSNSQNTCLLTNDVQNGSGDAVYQFTVSANATVVMDMCTGTTFDSFIYLCDAGMTVLASNDDYCGTASYLSYNVTPGTYNIIVEGYWDGACGNYTLQVSVPNAAPIPVLATLPDLTGECTVTATAPTATDCAATITGTTTDPLTYTTQGTSTITWTYNDGAGFTTTQTQNVIIDDITAPVPDLGTLPDLIAEGTVTASAPTATDACVGTVTGTTTDPLTYTTEGTYVITWTYNDGNGNTITQTQNVTVLPSLIVIGELIGTYNCGVPYSNSQNTCYYSNNQMGSSNDVLYQFTLSADATVVLDMCASGTTTYDSYLYLCNDAMGVITSNDDYCSYGASYLTATITAGTYYIVAEGYSTSCGNYNLQVSVPNTAPVPDVTTLADVTGECTATLTTPTATDACAGAITGTTLDPTTYSTIGTYLVTWSYNDGNGGISTQTQNVIVDDFTAPVADLTTLPDITGECSVTVSTFPTATDACIGSITATTADPLTYTTLGTHLITWTYTDSEGNSSTQTQNIVINDLTAPVANVATLPNVNGEGTVTVSAPTATDNCAGAITGTTTDPLTYTVPGTYTITWTYDDGNGNTSSQTQTVNVVPNPIVIGELVGVYDCGNVYSSTLNTCTLNSDVQNASGDAVYQFTVSANSTVVMDMCTGTDFDSYIYLCDAGMTVIASNDDYCGGASYLSYNVAPGTYNIIVEGYWDGACGNYTLQVSIPNAAPVPDVATLSDISGECVTVTTVPTATDACSGPVNGTTIDPLSYSAIGSYVVTWSYDDGFGAISTQTQNVIVTGDVSAPIADLTTLPDILGDCSATVDVYPTATDNCAGAITGTTTDPVTYTTAGTYSITWTYDDGNGNTSTQTQNVVIDDVTGPIADVTTLPDVLGECDAVVSAVPTATDICSGPATGTTTDALTYNTQGTHVITWTYTDGDGNTSTQTQNVIIEDVTAPVADLVSLVDVTGECSVTVSTVPTATDNCVGAINGTTLDPMTYTVPGDYVITWTFDDGNGNTSTQTQNVSVTDEISPVADLTTLEDITEECSATISVFPTATDACAGAITGTTTDPLTYTAQGTYTITWTYDDGNGNSSSQTQTVIISDETSPEIACVDNMVINLNDGETFYTVVADELNPASVDDNCGVDSYYNSVNSSATLTGEELAIGTHYIVWTATDAAGNIDTCETIVVVNPYVGISDLSKTGYSVYPNPSEGTVFVSLENNNSAIIFVRDALGRIVLEKQANSNLIEIDLNNVESGAYTIEINNNNVKTYEKVIIK